MRKEDVQKIALGSLLAVGVIYGYFDLLLGPLKKNQAATEKSLAALNPEIDKARAQIKRATDVADAAPKAAATLAQIDAMIPEGAPVAWFPTLIGDFFKKQGVDKITTGLASEAPEKELPGYKRVNWSVEVPKAESLSFAVSLAELENQEPLMEVQGITIEAQREDPEKQRVLLTLNSIVKL